MNIERLVGLVRAIGVSSYALRKPDLPLDKVYEDVIRPWVKLTIGQKEGTSNAQKGLEQCFEGMVLLCSSLAAYRVTL